MQAQIKAASSHELANNLTGINATDQKGNIYKSQDELLSE